MSSPAVEQAPIGPVDLAAEREAVGPALEEALLDCLRSGAYVLGPEVKAFEAEHRTRFTDEETSAIWVGYLPGSLDRDTTDSYTLALAFRGSSIVVLPDNILKSCEQLALTLPEGVQPMKACAYIEATTVMHELGHLLGLTDNGIPMVEDHKAEGTGDHCDQSDCIMYAYNNTEELFGRVLADVQAGKEIAPFGEQCQADVASAIAP